MHETRSAGGAAPQGVDSKTRNNSEAGLSRKTIKDFQETSETETGEVRKQRKTIPNTDIPHLALW
ncbi:MAG: hypothetical protein M3P29_00820, partial [Acidobacteriota bacterium]|nr:hypothetical protein [Acidobacteriota bacterium]